jgi:glucose-1-phosphate thymidylyltransferase
MKGIILAGGTGSRLWPATKVVSKQLMPIFDKPMIYYPLSTLMLAGVKEILIITTPEDQKHFKSLLGDGTNLGISIQYQVQLKPEGLAQALVIGESFLNGDSCLLILGDNIFHGTGLGHELISTIPKVGCHIFIYEVANPKQYGVLTLDSNQSPLRIVEKPQKPESNLAVTGLYFFDEQAVHFTREIKPSTRGELEITSLINEYLDIKQLTFTKLTRGTAWLDTGSAKSMHDASTYVRVIEERTGLKIGCIEEIAWRNKWISDEQLEVVALSVLGNDYGHYLRRLIENKV